MNNHRSKSKTEGVPAELLRSVPRQVAFTAAGWAALAAAVLLSFGGLLAGAWLYVAAERDVSLRREVASNAVSTLGEITSVQRRRGDDGKTEVAYRYTANGRDYAGRVRLSKRAGSRLAPGARIPVRFLASAPARSWLPGREPQGVEFWLVPLVALPLCAAGAVSALTLRRQHRLLACGRPALARVTEARKFSRAHNQGHGFHVAFEFHLLSGARRTGSFDVQKDPPQAGAASVIVYDPEHPRRHARYPLPLVRPEPAAHTALPR